ncbi:MAG: hypothetical protein GXW85_01845 [Clostridia bacterium]|nr:hypothetical protein [Clostridia bacterium]
MQKIVPHLWYDKEAKEAALFSINLFEQSQLVYTTVLKNPPPFGDAEKDQFGISWQVLPSNWEEVLFEGSEEEEERVNKALLDMKKIDLETLEKIKLGMSN